MKGKSRLEAQLKLHKIMEIPTAIYGNEAWIVRKDHETSIKTAQKQLLREADGYTSTDHQHNTKIWGKNKGL
jgi:hypothetical protein